MAESLLTRLSDDWHRHWVGSTVGGSLSEPFARQSKAGAVTTCLTLEQRSLQLRFVFSNLRNTTCGSFFERVPSWHFAK